MSSPAVDSGAASSSSSAASMASSASIAADGSAAAVAAQVDPSSLSIDSSQLQQAVVSGQHHHGGSAAAGDREASSNMHVTCKWKTHSYQLEIPASATVGFLKMQIALLTNVRSHHQKLMLPGAKLPPGQKMTDELQLAALSLKQPPKAVMIGNPEDELIMDDEAKAAALEPVDDLDYDWRPEALLQLAHDPAVKAKVEKYWNAVKDTFSLINPLRPGKKLLVLDLDYTLFDMKGTSSDWKVLKRPFTHRFLARMYAHYELVVWSQTSWRWLEWKLTELGILTHPNYKIAFVMDKTSMFSVTAPDERAGGSATRKHHVKCLDLIWRRFPQWSPQNTVHVDDLGRNFALNPQSGLKIAPYKNSDVTRATDRELPLLARYLADIADSTDFSKLDHSKWKKHVESLPPEQ